MHSLVRFLLLFGEDTGQTLSQRLSGDSVAAQLDETDHCDPDN